MDEKALKTSWTQRIIIIVIAVLLLGSTVLAYIFIVLGSGSSQADSQSDQLAELQSEYDAKNAELKTASEPLSDQYFSSFVKYKSEVKAYNSTNANASGLESKDLQAGTGRTLTEGDTNYLTYYIGWCADSSIFSSSFNNNDDPTSLNPPLSAAMGLIEGWNQGVIGMKLGGVRQINIPGELAYGETKEICGGKNSPLHFIVMALEPKENIMKLYEDLNAIEMQMYYLIYGGATK